MPIPTNSAPARLDNIWRMAPSAIVLPRVPTSARYKVDVIARVLKHWKAEVQTSRLGVVKGPQSTCLVLDQLLAQLLESVALEVVHARIVSVEGRAADICGPADILDGDRL